MNKQQAIEAMVQGKRVRHRFFTADEFIWLKHGKVHDEKGYCLDHSESQNFWAFRTDMNIWNKDWDICEGEITEDIEKKGVGKEFFIHTIIRHMQRLSNEERLEVFSSFCVHCGGKDPKCQCANDE